MRNYDSQITRSRHELYTRIACEAYKCGTFKAQTEREKHNTARIGEAPQMSVIKSMCNKCPEKIVRVTDMCARCHEQNCASVCPVNAIEFDKCGRSHITSKCIKCGKCVEACPYHAIVKQERPCASACGVSAIKSDAEGYAEIDHNKCVACGMCMVHCPFGAIIDKSQIVETISAIKNGKHVIATVAPSFIGQFPGLTPDKFTSAMKELGFADVVEVAIGADLCTIDEAHDFLKKVPTSQPYMATSCCPAWTAMARNTFPDAAKNVSMALTPMIFTGRLIKKQKPDSVVVFIGPCTAKKLEAIDTNRRTDIDFVLTYAELSGMLSAKNINFETLKTDDKLTHASADGRGYAVSGGVANAVVNCLKNIAPDRVPEVVSAQGLADCRKMLALARAGKYNGCLLEGMSCPGGCMGGAGTICPTPKTSEALKSYKQTAPFETACDSSYAPILPELE